MELKHMKEERRRGGDFHRRNTNPPAMEQEINENQLEGRNALTEALKAAEPSIRCLLHPVKRIVVCSAWQLRPRKQVPLWYLWTVGSWMP